MEAAIRWSAGSGNESNKYLLVDVAGNNITLNQYGPLDRGQLSSKTIATYDKVPNFTAFDWSKSDDSLVALGLSSGDASLVKIEEGLRNTQPLRIFPIKTQRKCNSITFNSGGLLAVGLDRVRNDHSLTVYDVEGGKEPHSRLCTGEAVSSIKFFPGAPQELVAAVARTTLRLYDLRDSSYSNAGSGISVYTKQVNNIAIDPLDDNYMASGGSTGDPTISVWDKRLLNHPTSASADGASSTPVLEFRPAVDNSVTTTVWSIRFSGLTRGRFGVLSSTGEVKLYDMATHPAPSKNRPVPANFYGGSPWGSPQYIAQTHNLQHPYHHSVHPLPHQSESARVIAFDWVTSGSGQGQAMLALHPTREVDFLYGPNPGHVNLTPRDDLAICREDVAMLEATRSRPTVAGELLAIEAKAQESLRGANRVNGSGQEPRAQPLDSRSLNALRSSSISDNRTQRWLEGGLGSARPFVDAHEFRDSLTLINVHRRRCQEGYRFDCRRNEQIVREDLDLVKLWKIVGRLEGLSRDKNMATESLDLSFLGVQPIWNGHLGNSPNRRVKPRDHSHPHFDQAVKELVELHGLPELDGLPSRTASKRLLCLEICGWCFSREGIEAKCKTLLEQDQHYRAVAVAVFQGHSDLALVLLRNLVRTKIIENTGVAALLASESMNAEQREMCQWMEEDATDPYLRSLLRYLGTKDWSSVVQDSSLNLSDRLSIALRYLYEPDVATFIYETTTTCINDGDLSGILLTGLTEASMNLFQKYLSRTNDLQTVVLATSFSNPVYVDDVRWSMWKETYLWHMQAWRTFIERTKFTTQHARRAVTRNGDHLIKPAPRQITLRCAHCNGSLAKQHDETAHKHKKPSGHNSPAGPTTGGQAQRVAAASGTVCPKCGRHLPRCSICMQWLGTPESLQSKHNKTGTREIDGGKETGAAKRETELLGRFVTFCASCGHGFHAHHAKHWFAKHGMCPVPDCRCLCGLRG